jgi:hypothetical protein
MRRLSVNLVSPLRAGAKDGHARLLRLPAGVLAKTAYSCWCKATVNGMATVALIACPNRPVDDLAQPNGHQPAQREERF